MAFSITSLSLLSFPDHSPTSLVTVVNTTSSSNSTHSFLLVHVIVAPPPVPQDLPTPSPQAATPQLDSDLSSFNSKSFYFDLSPSTPPPLPHLPTSTEDTSSSPRGGSLSLLSLLPISTLLPDLHGNLEVWLTHPLTISRLLAVYAGRPRPPGSAEVKGDTNEDLRGCLMMLKCGEEKGGVASVPVVRRVTLQEEEGVVDMCHVAMGDGGDVKEMLVVVTTGGEIQILDVISLQVE